MSLDMMRISVGSSVSTTNSVHLGKESFSHHSAAQTEPSIATKVVDQIIK